MVRFCFGFMKFLLILENAIVALLAAGLIYVSVNSIDRDFGLDTLNDNHPKAVHFFISAISAGIGIIIILLSSLGLFGAIIKSKTLLYMYAGIVFSMIFILAIFAGITLTIKSGNTKYKDVDKNFVNETIALYKFTELNDVKTKLLDHLQERLKCCGINTPNDWVDYGQHKIPKSCCFNRTEFIPPMPSMLSTLPTQSSSIFSSSDTTATTTTTGNQPNSSTSLMSYKYCEQSDYKVGCWPALTDYFHSNLNSVRSMLYVIITVGLFSSISAFLMSRRIKQKLEVV